MKKCTIILAFLVAMTLDTTAQIPNYSFENWSNGTNSAPDGWSDHGSHHAGFYPVTQTTDNYLGAYAARLENKITATDTTLGVMHTTRPNDEGGFGPAFPVDSRYNNLKGFYKYTPLNGDSAQIIVFLTKTGFSGTYDDLIAYGQKHLGAASTYTPFSVGYREVSPNFYYLDNVVVPDSGYINIGAYKGLGDSVSDLPPLGNSVLIIDALNFDSYLTGISDNMDITKNFVLYPSVSHAIFNVSFETTTDEFTTIRMYDLLGRKVKELFNGNLTKGPHTFQYNLPDLNNGNYLYVVATDKGYKAAQICIQK